MKKLLISVIACLVLVALPVVGLAGCKKKKSEPLAEYTITFEYGKGFENGTATVVEGERATKPTVKANEGLEVGSWYTDKECTKAYNFRNEVHESFTLYAGWIDPFEYSDSANYSEIYTYKGKASEMIIPRKHGDLPVVGFCFPDGFLRT